MKQIVSLLQYWYGRQLVWLVSTCAVLLGACYAVRYAYIQESTFNILAWWSVWLAGWRAMPVKVVRLQAPVRAYASYLLAALYLVVAGVLTWSGGQYMLGMWYSLPLWIIVWYACIDTLGWQFAPAWYCVRILFHVIRYGGLSGLLFLSIWSSLVTILLIYPCMVPLVMVWVAPIIAMWYVRSWHAMPFEPIAHI